MSGFGAGSRRTVGIARRCRRHRGVARIPASDYVNGQIIFVDGE